MKTCSSCGWEVRQDFGAWLDNFGGAVCFWIDGVEFAHSVQDSELIEIGEK